MSMMNASELLKLLKSDPACIQFDINNAKQTPTASFGNNWLVINEKRQRLRFRFKSLKIQASHAVTRLSVSKGGAARC